MSIFGATGKIMEEIEMSRNDERPMSVGHAAHILCRVHTGDDDVVGFHIRVGASPEWGNGVSTAEYLEAWAVMRREAGLSFGPTAEHLQFEELLRDVIEHSHPPVGKDTEYLRQKHDEVMAKALRFLGIGD